MARSPDRRSRDAGLPNLEGYDPLKRWLRGKPHDWSVAIAARTAARVLPFLRDAQDLKSSILPVFRAIAIARLASKSTDTDIFIAAASDSAAKAADDVARTTVLATSDAAYAAARASAAAGYAARGASAADAAARSADGAAKAAASAHAERAVFAAIKYDAQQLHEAILTPAQLASIALWPGLPPPRIGGAWQGLAHELRQLNGHWSVWIEWYDNLLSHVPILNDPWDWAFSDLPGKLPWEKAKDANRAIEERLRKLRGHVADSSKENLAQQRSDDDSSKDVLPPIATIPSQTSRAITFTPATLGPLALLPDTPSAVDPEQTELYARMRTQLTALLEATPSQERVQFSTLIEDFLSQPSSWGDVQFKKVLWLCGNALRNVLAQHDAVKDSLEPHYAKLPPAVGEALRRPIESWNIAVLGDPVLRDLDARRLGPQESELNQAQVTATRPLLEAAANDRGVTTLEAAAALRTTLEVSATAGDNLHQRQAQDLTAGTAQNLTVQILRGAHRVAQDLQDPNSEEARALVKEYKSGIYKELGAWTVKGAAAGIVGAGATAYFYGIPFMEFVVAHGQLLKAYLPMAFQNPELTRIVDVIIGIRIKLFSKKDSDHA